MIRFLYFIAIGSLFVATISIFSPDNEAQRRQESKSALQRLYKLPSSVIE